MSQAAQNIDTATDGRKVLTPEQGEAIKARAGKPAKRAATKRPAPTGRAGPKGNVRQPITIELVRRMAPDTAMAERIGTTFGLMVPDCEALADATHEHLVALAGTVGEAMGEKGLQIWADRIVGGFVGAAHGAARFYGQKAEAAREMTVRLRADHRDEDRDEYEGRSYSGFETKAQFARRFAAEMAMQAHAALAAAEGALTAYRHVIGAEWVAYNAEVQNARPLTEQAADYEMAAFARD